MVSNDIPERISQGYGGAQNAEDGGLEKVADWLRGSLASSLAELEGNELRQSPHGLSIPEHILAEKYALENNCWIEDVSVLGEIGPCGDENYCYINPDGSLVFKVNMLTHTGERILAVFDKVRIHNSLFPETRYSFIGFTNMGFARSAFPIFAQPYVQHATNATMEEIKCFMENLGFVPYEKKTGGWRFVNYIVWDVLPKNVLRDKDGDLFVVDAELGELTTNA